MCEVGKGMGWNRELMKERKRKRAKEKKERPRDKVYYFTQGKVLYSKVGRYLGTLVLEEDSSTLRVK